MSRPAYWWLGAGLAALAGAIIIPAIDGGELSEAWWSVMAGLFLTGIGLLITGVVKISSRRTGRATP
jgi:branched-subunit amino acid permease